MSSSTNPIEASAPYSYIHEVITQIKTVGLHNNTDVASGERNETAEFDEKIETIESILEDKFDELVTGGIERGDERLEANCPDHLFIAGGYGLDCVFEIGCYRDRPTTLRCETETHLGGSAELFEGHLKNYNATHLHTFEEYIENADTL